MKSLIVSAPFGNYHRFLKRVIGDDFTPTLGTFTWERRGFWTKPYGGPYTRLLLTLRYSTVFKSWKNRIGLKNPGIAWLKNEVQPENGTMTRLDVSDKIVSVYGWNQQEWKDLFTETARLKPLAIEVNASCPNVHKPPFSESLFELAMKTGIKIIVKVPPVGFQTIVKMAHNAGIRYFHATNTLPTPKGGMSGKSLLPIALEAVRQIREAYPEVTIIGGGGITTAENASDFVGRGANHVAIGTMLFNPLNWRTVRSIGDAVSRGNTLIGLLK